MKKIIYVLILCSSWFFPGCQDITVGYLMTENASYSLDTLYIYNMKARLKDKTETLDAFKAQTKDLQVELEEKRGIYAEKKQEADDYFDGPYADAENAYYDIIEGIDPDGDEEAALKRLEECEIELDRLTEIRDDAELAMNDVMAQINAIAEKLGVESQAILEKEIADLQDRMDYKLPWTTPRLEGVLGTEPLIYSIVSVKSDNSASAAKFMKSTGVLGGGRIYVEIDVDVPVGAYVVSLLIKNEGRSAVLKDVFTFIVEE